MLTPEQREMRGMAREVASGELRPRSLAWDADGALGEGVVAGLADLGFLGMRLPEGLGGLGLDPVTCLVVLEELAWGDPAAAFLISLQNGPVADLLLSRGRREALLAAVAEGRGLGAVGSGAGVGAAAGEPFAAVSVGDGWSLKGGRGWLVGGGSPGFLLLPALVDGRPALFLADPPAPGLELRDRVGTMGFRALHIHDLAGSEPELPEAACLAGPGHGAKALRSARIWHRAGSAAVALGIAGAALDHALRYAGEREQFGRPIRDFEAIREKLGGMAAQTAVARWALHSLGEELQAVGPGAAGDGAGGGGLEFRSAAVLLAASEAALHAADEAVQIFGGYGYMRDYPVEKLLRDARGLAALAGSGSELRLKAAEEIIREVGSAGD